MKTTNHTLVRLFKIGINFRKYFILALIISILLAITSTYRPVLSKIMVDEDIIQFKDMGKLLKHIWVLVALVVLEVFLNFAMVYYSNFISQNVIREIRERLYRKLIYFKTSFFDKSSVGMLVTRAVGDVETIATVYTDGFLMVFGDVLRIVMVMIVMFNLNIQLSLVAVAILPIMFMITRFFQKKFKVSFGEERSWTSQQNSFVLERLLGMQLVQAFNRQDTEYRKFVSINHSLKEALLKTVFYFSLFFPVVELITSLSIGLILLLAGYNALYNQSASAGDVIAFIQFISMLMRPLRQIADRFNNIQRGIVGAERVFGIMDGDKAMPNLGTLEKNDIEGKIEFKQVHFAYNEKEKVLKGINLKVEAGQNVAIVGATGAGKSTIIQLITRFYDVDQGQILLDGTDIRDYEISNLRGNIGVVLQDVFLFHNSILENISLGDPNITLEQVQKIAKEIGIHDFIESLPGAYHFVVKERGTSISLGQRQLLSFLRAYLLNPKILILDEATSSVDPESELLIQQATERITKNRTSIIIAHRLSTIEKADKIVVMDKGLIVEQGTHSELLAKGMYYAKLHRLQK